MAQMGVRVPLAAKGEHFPVQSTLVVPYHHYLRQVVPDPALMKPVGRSDSATENGSAEPFIAP